jgi:hypothetical protein
LARFAVSHRRERRSDEEDQIQRGEIADVLREVEAGTPVADVCRSVGMSETTLYLRKKPYARLGVSELRKLTT